MNINQKVLNDISAALREGEVPLDAIPWHFAQEHELTDRDDVLSRALAVVGSLVSRPDVVVTELRDSGFVPWSEIGDAALEKLVRERTRSDGCPIPHFGWSDQPQLFLLLSRFVVHV